MGDVACARCGRAPLPIAWAFQGPATSGSRRKFRKKMGMRPFRVVSCFASLAAAVICLAVVAQVAVASPTPDPAPASVTPTPDPVSTGATPPRSVNRNSSSRVATTRRARTTTRSTGSSIVTRSSGSIPAVAATTVGAPKSSPKQKDGAGTTQPTIAASIALPVVAPAPARTPVNRDGDLPLGAAIALGALALASLSLVVLTRRMRTALSAG